MGGTGILGGTFNPVHNGHIRLAIEAGEALALDRVVLMPCPDPPHKGSSGLLPFPLRLDLVRAAIGHIPFLEASDLESRLPHPSYTWRTLSEWRRLNGTGELYFMMGAESFAALNTWYRGLEIPELAHVVMVPRDGGEGKLFSECIRKFWPGSLDGNVPFPQTRTTVCLAGGGKCTFLPAPRLDISSTHIRALWRSGRSLAGLLPAKEMQLLAECKSEVDACWAEETAEKTQEPGHLPD